MSSTSLTGPVASSALADGAAASAAPKPTKEQIHQAAQKFESMLVNQMLSQARKTDFGNTLLTNEGTKTFREMQDSRFADTAAKQGKLGFAKMIEAQLSRQTHLDTAPASATPTVKTGG